jgi:hypothetical protein
MTLTTIIGREKDYNLESLTCQLFTSDELRLESTTMKLKVQNIYDIENKNRTMSKREHTN